MTPPDVQAVPERYAFDRFFHLSHDLCCIAGFDGYFKALNEVWTSTLGYTVAALSARPFIDFVHPEDVESTMAQARRLSQGEDVLAFENRYRCADGSYRWLRWACRGDVAERLIYGSARDVTGERQAIARLETAHVQLREHAAGLEASNQELESLSYSVSHDLRAPLRAIDGFSHQIEERDHDRLSDQGRHALSRVRAAVGRMNGLIDDLLELSRLARMEMFREHVDLSGLAAEVVVGLRRRQPSREVSITVQPGMVAHGDLRMLRIVMDHLVGNAWKYSSRRDGARIDVTSRADGSQTTYTVADNGAGFDMKYAAKLFEPFQRLHTDKEFDGTGVGLATVRRIVRRHGGRIWAQSAPGEGAAFMFTLGEQGKG